MFIKAIEVMILFIRPLPHPVMRRRSSRQALTVVLCHSGMWACMCICHSKGWGLLLNSIFEEKQLRLYSSDPHTSASICLSSNNTRLLCDPLSPSSNNCTCYERLCRRPHHQRPMRSGRNDQKTSNCTISWHTKI